MQLFRSRIFHADGPASLARQVSILIQRNILQLQIIPRHNGTLVTEKGDAAPLVSAGNSLKYFTFITLHLLDCSLHPPRSEHDGILNGNPEAEWLAYQFRCPASE